MAADPALPQTSSPLLFAPVQSRERISSVDVLRGFALFGILWMNIVAFALPGAAYGDPTVAGGASGANFIFWLFSQILVEGKMRTIFSMLFGAGAVLLTSRAEERGAGARVADIYYRRTMWLIVFGLLHAYFIWSGDILYGYGVAGLLLFPFRKQSPRLLIAAGLVVLAVLAPKSILYGRHLESLRARAALADAAAASQRPLTDEQREAQTQWREKMTEMKPSRAEVDEEIADHRGGYGKLFPRRMKDVSRGQSKGFYRFGFFDVAGMMLLGMGFLKLDIFSAQRSRGFYAALAALGYAVGIPINWIITQRDAAASFDPAEMFFGFSGYDLGRLAVALGHVAVVLLICKAGILRGLTSRLAAVGQMALSNYLGTSIVCVLLFDGSGFGLFGRFERVQLLYVVLPIWIAQAILSPLWLRRYRFGPMEWVWRSLTYWQPQPMRLDAAVREAAPRPAAAGTAA